MKKDFDALHLKLFFANWLMRARTVFLCTLMCGLFIASGSVPAQSQSLFDFWSKRTYSPGHDYRALLSKRDIRRILRRKGYRLAGSVRRNGRVYHADVRNRAGRSGRVIVDGMRGDILQWFDHRFGRLGSRDAGPPRPSGRIGRGFSDYAPPRDLSGRRAVRRAVSRPVRTSAPRRIERARSAKRGPRSGPRSGLRRDRSRVRAQRQITRPVRASVPQPGRPSIVSRPLRPPVDKAVARTPARTSKVDPISSGNRKAPPKSAKITPSSAPKVERLKILPAPAAPAPVAIKTKRPKPQSKKVVVSEPRKMKPRRKRGKPRVIYAGPGAIPHSGPPKPMAQSAK